MGQELREPEKQPSSEPASKRGVRPITLTLSSFLGTAAAIAVSLFAVSFFADRLPRISVSAEQSKPQSLHEALSQYVLRSRDEAFHLLQSPQPADWNTPEGRKQLYFLASFVPEDGEIYSNTGRSVEQLYETLLYSLRVGNDERLERLRQAVLESNKKDRDQAIKNLIDYATRPQSGPAPLAVGRALRSFHTATLAYVEMSLGDAQNFRTVIPMPAMEALKSSSVIVGQTVVVSAIPADNSGVVGQLAADIKRLEIAEVSFQRSWLDMTMIRNGPWVSGNPKLFGGDGSFRQLPVRLLLVKRPEMITMAAATNAEENSVRVGPFEYHDDEVQEREGGLIFAPKGSDWMILGLISKRIG
jgi:hypothetical protein